MRIESYSFGEIRIDGVDYWQDVILIGGEVVSGWWREAGGHIFAPRDLGRVIAAAPEIVLLGTGFHGAVSVQPATIKAFEAVASTVIIDRTPALIDHFNELAKHGRDVAAALHLTC